MGCDDCLGCLLVQTTQQLLVCVLVCFFVCVLVVTTKQRNNQKTLLISQFICRGGTPYCTLGFIPQ